ncbi:MAG TPA: EAL domain-containing protein [Candidatus Limnocylindria bacterium]|nr:EAL domain-containing protein [Candidatus Limnocylindria bacterium]
MRLVVWTGSLTAYLIAFALLVESMGTGVAALSALPGLFAGWLFGMRVGALAAVTLIPANFALLALAGHADPVSTMTAPGSFALLVVGIGAGRIRDLGDQLAKRAAEDAQRRRVYDVLANAPLYIGVTSGPEHRLSYVNDQLAKLVDARTAIGRPIAEVFPMVDTAMVRAIDAVFTTGEPFSGAEVAIAPSDTAPDVRFDIRIEPTRDGAGVIDGLRIFCLDVSAQVRARRGLDVRARQQAAVAVLGQRALADTPIAQLYAEACAVIGRLLGVDAVAILESPSDEAGEFRTSAAHGIAHDAVVSVRRDSPMARTLFGGQAILAVERDGSIEPALYDGGTAIARGMLVAIRGRSPAFGILSVSSRRAREFTVDDHFFLEAIAAVLASALDRTTADAELQRQAMHDALTGLPNRRLLHDRLEQAIRFARRHERTAALIVLDLDRFKLVNDAFGHHDGDRLLGQVAERLRAVVRDTDTVARLGGDEFAIVLADTHDADDVSYTAGRVAGALAEPFVLEERTLRISASMGAAMAPRDGESADTVLRRADMAMYTAKRAGGGFRFFSAALEDKVSERLALASDLRDALEGDGLSLAFQPKVDMASGRISGAEALLRWKHPRLGPIPPDRLVAAAEQNGLIHPLTRWVLDEAARHCHAWQKLGLTFGVAVNVSMLNLRDNTLGSHIDELLAAGGCPPGKLTLEITESSTAGDMGEVLQILGTMRSHGIRLSIDDYGTGYSSLAHVRRMPVDEIKIDRSFLNDMLTNSSSDAIVRSTIELAHSLGLRVVAEGVETADVWDALRALGCDEVQGYFISRPLSPQDFTAWAIARAIQQSTAAVRPSEAAAPRLAVAV